MSHIAGIVMRVRRCHAMPVRSRLICGYKPIAYLPIRRSSRNDPQRLGNRAKRTALLADVLAVDLEGDRPVGP